MYTWKNGTSRFGGHPPKWDGRSNGETAKAAETADAARGNKFRLSTAEMATIFHNFLEPYGDNPPPAVTAGWELTAKVYRAIGTCDLH